MALNNARYHELGGGYSLGMVLCWLGPNSESQILFLVAPKTGGKPQLLRFEEWRDKKFVPVDVVCDGRLSMPSTRRITSYQRYSASGICAHGRRMDLDRQRIQDDRLLGQAGLQRTTANSTAATVSGSFRRRNSWCCARRSDSRSERLAWDRTIGTYTPSPHPSPQRGEGANHVDR